MIVANRVVQLYLVSGVKSKSKLYYNRQSVGQSVLMSGTHLGPVTNFSSYFCLIIFSYGFVDAGRPL
jgi:hypothetical protein